MREFEPFRCSECGHEVHLARGAGRTREYVRGVVLPIPEDFELPTCSSCGELHMIPEFSTRLDALLRARYLREQSVHCRELVELLLASHGITQGDVEAACAVTPSYLSHVLAGRKQASITLIRLLEAFVSDGGELERHLAGRGWSRPNCYPFLVKEPRARNGFSDCSWAKHVGPIPDFEEAIA